MKKIMKILLHIGAGIMLSVFIYKCGEAADSPASEMTEAEKSVLFHPPHSFFNTVRIHRFKVSHTKA